MARDWRYQVGHTQHWSWHEFGLGLKVLRVPDRAATGWMVHGQFFFFWWCVSVMHIYAWPGKSVEDGVAELLDLMHE